MRAIVLVGGFGTRLRPLTYDTPKPLLPIGNRPILEHIVARLARSGVDEVVLSLGFRPDAFRDAFPDGRCAGIPLVYAVEPEPLDTAGAIRFAADYAQVDDTFAVLNGDVLTSLDLSKLIAFHRAANAEATLHLTPVDDPSAFGVVVTTPEGRVTTFVEKPPRDEAPSNTISAGSYVLEPSVLERIPRGRKFSIERDVFPKIVADHRLFAMVTDDYWVDTGKPDTYLQANLDLLDGRFRSDVSTEIDGSSAAPAQVHAKAVVRRSVIGNGARVDDGATVVDSVLLDGVHVASGASVTGSLVGARSVIGSGANVIGLSVVGNDVDIAAGTALDGARVPEPT
ncbi:MAG: sugar phosphate nucleotidyltransferase [Acidimicrobiia bacterium]